MPLERPIVCDYWSLKYRGYWSPRAIRDLYEGTEDALEEGLDQFLKGGSIEGFNAIGDLFVVMENAKERRL
ncbi:hypothetical protein BGX38DRAFT_1269264 [Terfezia claveryi]|nr:hypothetical protein BGX38DRAFT_1269264 [Terfezia claveryi]